MIWKKELTLLLVCIFSGRFEASNADQMQVRDLFSNHALSGKFKRSAGSHTCSPVKGPDYPRDCSEIQNVCGHESLVSGEYEIQPEHFPSPFIVYCDFETEGEAWTVIQRRLDGSINFQRTWNDYKNGFGFLKTEFWLGNEKLSYLTAQSDYELRIDLRNQHDQPYYAQYSTFRVGDESMKYRLILGADYSGDAANSLQHQNLQFFSTFDADHDKTSDETCADENRHGGGWWFGACDSCNLNGAYGVMSDYNPGGIDWDNLPGGNIGLKRTEMKIRPVG